MRLGFLIDHSRCIGCHACSVACKEEHHVPLGAYRTWVKYVEKGTFPDVQRSFSVLRCNHCDNAPCVTVCPTTALFRADNGIIDFDNQHCIGCKACLQACPYDALYIDPATQTAAKCNFCAHRVDQGLKPSCEVVCPEQAILSGDLDDPGSRISRFVQREPVTVRKPEQGTRPKLFYRDVDKSALDPLAARRGEGYQFATEQDGFGSDTLLRLLGQSGGGLDPALLEEADQRARTTFDVVHHRPWGGKVSAYIFTKSIAAGAVLVAALARLCDQSAPQAGLAFAGTLLGLLFLGITSVLLVVDLKQPKRFLKILLRPQMRSWLALGAFVLTAYGGLLTVHLAVLWFGGAGSLEAGLHYLAALVAIPAAIYTGFLFGQLEGRDYWQNPALPIHLFLQAVLAGSATLLLVHAGLDSAGGADLYPFLRWTLLGSLVLDLLVVLFSEVGMRHGTRDAAAASRWMTHGPGALAYWVGVLLLGRVVPLLLLCFAGGAFGGAVGRAPVQALSSLHLVEP